MACHCHAAMSGLLFFFSSLICWGFCSKKLCTPEPYYKLEVSRKWAAGLLLFFVSTVLFWVCGWFTNNPYGVLHALLLWNAKTQVLKGLTLDSAVSLPLYYLNRCSFVAPALTGTPPRWFISLVGLLAAAGDRTEEPGLSHQGNESEKEREERSTTASQQPLFAAKQHCAPICQCHICRCITFLHLWKHIAHELLA